MKLDEIKRKWQLSKVDYTEIKWLIDRVDKLEASAKKISSCCLSCTVCASCEMKAALEDT